MSSWLHILVSPFLEVHMQKHPCSIIHIGSSFLEPASLHIIIIGLLASLNTYVLFPLVHMCSRGKAIGLSFQILHMKCMLSGRIAVCVV